MSNPKLKTAIFSTWTDNRTKLLGDGLPEAGGIKLDYYFDELELDKNRFEVDSESDRIRKIDDLVANNASEYLLSNAPDLSWVYLQHTDDIGHQHGDSEQFLKAVGLMDFRVGKISEAVTVRQKNYPEDWLAKLEIYEIVYDTEFAGWAAEIKESIQLKAKVESDLSKAIKNSFQLIEE